MQVELKQTQAHHSRNQYNGSENNQWNNSHEIQPQTHYDQGFTQQPISASTPLNDQYIAQRIE